MSQRNETPLLIGSLMITAALLGGGYWWYSQKNGGAPIALPGGSGSQEKAPPASTGGNFAAVQAVPTGQFTYGGSTSFAPIRLAVDSAIQTTRSEFRLQYVNPTSGAASSGSGIQMLLDRKVDFAQISRALSDGDRAKAQGLGVTLQEVPVAIDGLAVAVNPTLVLPGLTLEQLKGIYSGQIVNWQAVGGPNLAIVPISRPVGSGGTVELFQSVVMGGAAFGDGVQFANTTTQALKLLSSTPGGLYYASAPEIVPQCTTKPLPIGRNAGTFVPPYAGGLVAKEACPAQRNQLNRQAFRSGEYPMTRNLYVVFKQDQGRSQQAGQAYANLLLSDQGQKLLQETGFVPLR
jgi:phosphate transport system substrate-binding protein